MTAAEILERKAEEYRAMAQEHDLVVLAIVELILRELAAALEAEREAA